MQLFTICAICAQSPAKLPSPPLAVSESLFQKHDVNLIARRTKIKTTHRLATRVNTRSNRGISAVSAGTNEPTCAKKTHAAMDLRYTDWRFVGEGSSVGQRESN